AMIPLAFHGGTSLRFLYSIGRFSEDLDFALERPGRGYDFRYYLRAVRADFEREGYAIDVKANDRKVVHSAFLRFRGLLHELGLSPHLTETLAIKVEIDTRPLDGAVLATTVIRRHETLQLQHHDRASLLAGKIHAVLQRYTKGRDLYDLQWYLSDPDWPSPNLRMLNNALAQSGWDGPDFDAGNWHAILRQRIDALDWAKVIDDVRPFVESPAGLEVLTRENLSGLLDRRRLPRKTRPL
ncbi:MAG: nucleotidyl transferase AbiEii/AbiGii toxin family protein, partial [bacterium]|nr:nucleotidyl transferase AbiEii/AbiGii toxin family protein [bacterium]